jgi:deoxyribodipyrimidine photolyase-related protein
MFENVKKLRLILGDQLNEKHQWFNRVESDTLYVLAELKQETDYVKHHVQKVCAFFLAMHEFSRSLESKGHRVLYLTLDETKDYSDLNDLVCDLISKCECKVFEYQQPDEYRVHKQLQSLSQTVGIVSNCYDTEHFFIEHSELRDYIVPQRHNRMELFYRKMRKRFGILMEGDSPLGGRWNFDEFNRNKLTASDIAALPQALCFENPTSDILARLHVHKVETFGEIGETIIWPINGEQAKQLLVYFCQVGLPDFGKFQDAMTCNSPHAWSLYHSRLSFALNIKVLNPRDVIDAAIDAYYENTSSISLAQVEGFVRQILGWREYVRAVYWVNMPEYETQNALGARENLPSWFWNGETKMACVSQCIKQSLEFAYAHHIQRLMVIGNFALLAGIDPQQVDDWYLGIYIDALQWVELPNTRGMALYADGGWIATKPYSASGNYINKMSDYCRTCHYNVKDKTGPSACPFNVLYWYFFGRHEGKLSKNQRLSFVAKQWAKKTPLEKQSIHESANKLLENINEL